MKAVMDLGFWEMQIIFFGRIILAMLCGGIIGIERQQRIKVAGTRTHMMISVAAALMMIISKYGFIDVMAVSGASWDVSRVAASIITGIGILGGIIITGKQGSVSGTTTAAGLMATIAVGMAFGSGLYVMGFSVTAIFRAMWGAAVSFRISTGSFCRSRSLSWRRLRGRKCILRDFIYI